MAYINKCPFCQTVLQPSDPRCPKCGAENMFYGVDMSGDDYQNRGEPRPEESRSEAPRPEAGERFSPASTGKCPFCGGVLRSDEKTCPHCGADNAGYIEDKPRTIQHPKTVDELKEYCAERGMPLLRMRFFLDEDYKEPKAFGIYRDGDSFVVYKNKADGSRAVRYRGPDEAHAVDELFQKLLSECHNRGIYPDGKPVTRSSGGNGDRSGSSPASSRSRRVPLLTILMALLGVLALFLLLKAPVSYALKHRGDGYYDYGNGTLYYKNGETWCFTNDPSPDGTWTSIPRGFLHPVVMGDRDPFLGKEYRAEWGFSPYSWSRDTRNREGYYDFGDGRLYYLLDIHRSSPNGLYDYYALYYTGADSSGSWYPLGEVSLAFGSGWSFSELALADGSVPDWNNITDNFLSRSYDAAWAFSPFDEAAVQTPKAGYYRFGDGQLYYLDKKGSWHHTSDSGSDSWHYSRDTFVLSLEDGNSLSPDEWDSGYLGSSWDSDWGGSSYSSSSGSSSDSSSDSWSSSSDYDSWDSGSTDWDSDW